MHVTHGSFKSILNIIILFFYYYYIIIIILNRAEQ